MRIGRYRHAKICNDLNRNISRRKEMSDCSSWLMPMPQNSPGRPRARGKTSAQVFGSVGIYVHREAIFIFLHILIRHTCVHCATSWRCLGLRRSACVARPASLGLRCSACVARPASLGLIQYRVSEAGAGVRASAAQLWKQTDIDKTARIASRTSTRSSRLNCRNCITAQLLEFA